MQWLRDAVILLRPHRCVDALIVLTEGSSNAIITGNDVPVPFDDIFPSDVVEGAETFDVEFDPDGSNTGHSTTNNDENTEAFGEVFIDSPNAQSVSSMALISDWTVTSCDPRSDQPQTVSMLRQFPPFSFFLVTQSR